LIHNDDMFQMGVIDYSLYLKEILSQPAPEEERYGDKSC